MKWYTCIVHVPWHVSPVQVFHTRAETVEAAVRYAEAWLQEPNHDASDVEFVFEGKLECLPIGEPPFSDEEMSVDVLVSAKAPIKGNNILDALPGYR